MTYILIDYLTGKFFPIDLPCSYDGFLKSCHDLLSCDHIEVTYTIYPDLYLIIDERAKLFNSWQHRINSPATELHGDPFDVIVGNAIIARIDGEDFSPVTDEDIQFFCNPFLSVFF